MEHFATRKRGSSLSQAFLMSQGALAPLSRLVTATSQSPSGHAKVSILAGGCKRRTKCAVSGNSLDIHRSTAVETDNQKYRVFSLTGILSFSTCTGDIKKENRESLTKNRSSGARATEHRAN